MTTGYLTSGFDLLNVRDLDLVAQASRRCSSLVLGVLSDELAELASGHRPVVPLAERMALVGHLRGVARVVEHAERTVPAELEGEADDLVVFVAADEPVLLEGSEVVLLTARRETASEILRTALRPPAASTTAARTGSASDSRDAEDALVDAAVA